ncbi:ubiquitin-conjugating enzyme E2 [Desulfocastanea catecholica]
MPASPIQLDEIYQQVREFFLYHPVISITPTKGSPPDKYKIVYRLTGLCTTGEGTIVEAIGHKIELGIPFGFPHVPPNCRPKGDIFHPDFAPATICLGDFWGQDRALADLIIHIGQMINGEFYSTTNAINEDAAVWYQNNSAKFPLARITWQIDNDSQSSADGSHIHPVDTLDEDDLNTEFNFLTLETGEQDEEIVLNTSFPEGDSASDLDLQLFTRLDRQKKYYTLLKNGENGDHSSDTLKNMCLRARDKIELVEKLHRDAKKFEKKGAVRIAFEKYQQIATIVADFPAIDAAIHRTKQSLALEADMHAEESFADFFDPYASVEAPVADRAPVPPHNKATAKTARRATSAKNNRQGVILAKKNNTNKIFLVLFLGILAIAMGSSWYFWFSTNTTLSEAKRTSEECTAALADNQFNDAKRLCTYALQLAEQTNFIHQDETQQLVTSLQQTLQAEKMTQGLTGNILYNGKYIPEDEAKTLLTLQQQLIEANTLFQDEKWPAAEQLFTTLLTQSENSAYLERPVIEDMQYKRLMAEFRMSYDPGQTSMRDSHWEDAIEKLFQAQKVLMSLPEADRQRYSTLLQEALLKSQFAHLKEQGDLSFTGADWLSAITAYNLALNQGQKAALSPESIDAIRNNMKRAELYTTINKGNKAFASGSWNDAIAAYSQASTLLSESRSMSGTAETDINILKLARIILQASIIRDRQIAQSQIDNNEFGQAKQTYQQILEKIIGNSLRTEEEFNKTAAEISTAIRALDEKIFLTEKAKYLKNNFQSLFVANYSSVIPENLSSPVISNTKKTKSKLIFRMQCTETGGGRPLTLVMFYAYDIKTSKWSLFSES